MGKDAGEGPGGCESWDDGEVVRWRSESWRHLLALTMYVQYKHVRSTSSLK